MPTISICIPVYNFSIEPLISKLSNEILVNSIDAEIIAIDDSSDGLFQNMNAGLGKKYPIRYIQLSKNVGRSAIRNLFVKYAQSPLLLFLDCDVMPASSQFISDYLSAVDKNKLVICGGIIYPKNPSSVKEKLHWKYGSVREAVPAARRNKNPYHHFLTSNFLIHRDILEKQFFNEELKGYGYEDTLYGIELKRNEIELKHIELPAEHLKIDTAGEFILKTESAMRNLCQLYKANDYRATLKQHIKLIKVYDMLATLRLRNLVGGMHSSFGEKIRNNILKGNTSLRLLDLYKLLFFSWVQQQEKQVMQY
jgi:glycosyltransferase involved in cell wall biosynthesis